MKTHKPIWGRKNKQKKNQTKPKNLSRSKNIKSNKQ